MVSLVHNDFTARRDYWDLAASPCCTTILRCTATIVVILPIVCHLTQSIFYGISYKIVAVKTENKFKRKTNCSKNVIILYYIYIHWRYPSRSESWLRHQFILKILFTYMNQTYVLNCPLISRWGPQAENQIWHFEFNYLNSKFQVRRCARSTL